MRPSHVPGLMCRQAPGLVRLRGRSGGTPYLPLPIVLVLRRRRPRPFFGWAGCVPATPGKRPRTKDDDEEDSDGT
jgi:hypothetical protein